MAGDVAAGAVLIELKAQYQDLKRNVAKAKSEIYGFGAAVDTTAKKVKRSGDEISATFDSMDKNAIKMTARLSRLTGVLFAAQNVFQSFSGGGAPNKGIAAASAGLSTFAGIALAFPNKFGLAAGSVLGLTSALVAYGKAAGDAISGSEALQASIEALNKVRFEFTAQKTAAGLLSGKNLGLDLLKIEVDEAESKLKSFVTRIAALKENDRFGLAPEEERTELATREKQAGEQASLVLAKRRDLAKAEAVKDRQALQDANKVLLEGTAIQLQAGLISPLEAIQVEAQAARKELDALLADPRRDPTALGLAINKTRDTQARLDAKKNLDGIATGFGDSVSRALGEAIISGKKPMEGLADVAGSLFENAIGNAMKQVSAGLAETLKALSGGSDLVGGALTTALGIGAGIFAHRQSKSSQEFSGVKSAVTDSTPLRGIVAGPSSVAIATVSQDIARANGPVVEALKVIARIASKIERNTSGGPGAGAGGSPMVAVPTA